MAENICTVRDCGRPAIAKYVPGMCNTHTLRKRRGVPLNQPPAGVRRLPEEIHYRDPQRRKMCSTCGAWRDEKQFGTTDYTVDGFRSKCRPCESFKARTWQKGISQLDYFEILESQGGSCAICGSTDDEFEGTFNIDHDHSCCPGKKACGECIRGILCPLCNMSLGGFRDSPDLLASAIQYLNQGVIEIE